MPLSTLDILMDWPLRPRDWSLHSLDWSLLSLAGWFLYLHGTHAYPCRVQQTIFPIHIPVFKKKGDAIMLFHYTGMSI